MSKAGRPQETLKRQLFAGAFTAGVSYGEIAKAIRTTRRTVIRWRVEMNLPQRLGPNGKIHVAARGRNRPNNGGCISETLSGLEH